MNYAETDKTRWVREVLDRHSGPLTRYALRMTGNIEEARDIVQDTFLKLCSSNRAQIEDHVAAWLYTVCRNRALDVLRKENRMGVVQEGQLENKASANPNPADVAELHDTNSHVLRVLETLPMNVQEVVRLKFQEGMSYREISDVTGQSVSNVGFLIHRAIKTIRRRLKADDGFETRTTGQEA